MNKKLLNKLYIPRDNGEGVCFNPEYMKEDNAELYAIYSAVSDAQRESGLSFDFAYTIGNIAVDILQEVTDWNDDEAIIEAIDQAVPVYTHELMTIYSDNSHIVDEAMESIGNDHGTSESRAKMGWYYAIEQMLHTIKSKLETLSE